MYVYHIAPRISLSGSQIIMWCPMLNLKLCTIIPKSIKTADKSNGNAKAPKLSGKIKWKRNSKINRTLLQPCK